MLVNKPIPICFKNKYGTILNRHDLMWGLLLEWYRGGEKYAGYVDNDMRWEPVFQKDDPIVADKKSDITDCIQEMRELATMLRAKADEEDNRDTDAELAFEAAASSIERVCDKWEPPARC